MTVVSPNQGGGAWGVTAGSHLEQVEVDLLGVRVLLFVDGHEEVLHVHHHPQQPVDLFLRHVLQVGHVVRWHRSNQ